MCSLMEIDAEALDVWRRHRGLSKRQLAAKANTSAGYLVDIERGVRSPTLAKVEQLAAALDVDVAQLVRAVRDE